MPSRPERNQEYVQRSHVKAWLLRYARPSTIDELIETVEDVDGSASDLQMLSAVRAMLIGSDPKPDEKPTD